MPLPETMNAIEITEPGGPEVLVSCERPIPTPDAGEVLIKVAAAGVNRPDVVQRMGLYPAPKGASDLPGLEVAGEIVALGSDVSGVALGDQVCALLTGGGYAEYAVADAQLCLPVPDGLSLAEAASLPETFFTVRTNVFDDAKLQAGETFLVHGGTSGIGMTAIAMAQAFGAKVIATAGSAEKCARITEAGATSFNYKEDDWETQIKALGGVDVVLDMVGGDYVAKNLSCLKPHGRHVSIAFLTGVNAQINIVDIMRKRLTLSGSTLRARPVEQKTVIADALRKKVWPLINQGKVKPVIDSSFALENASDAHRLMEASTHIGKIVLVV
ncbi:MAG: NAD(P)H-quinone oxidoreductase [Parvularculaceae bacterium]